MTTREKASLFGISLFYFQQKRQFLNLHLSRNRHNVTEGFAFASARCIDLRAQRRFIVYGQTDRPIFRTLSQHINTNKNNKLQNITQAVHVLLFTLPLSHHRSGALRRFDQA